MSFVPLLHLHALADGGVCFLHAAGQPLLMTRQDGQLHLYEGRCPHAGKLLAGGTVQGGVIRCPGHGLRFDLRSGRCLDQAGCPALTRRPLAFDGDRAGILAVDR